MARHRLYIPAEVREDIAIRIKEGVAETLAEFDSGEEDEDVFTGHLGARLTTRDRKLYVPDAEVPGVWTWSIRYRKFRGRGKGATEKVVGADGILELSLDSFGRKQTKSLLFQSKMGGSYDKRLVEQCAKLSTWREASAVFIYSPDQLGAMSIDRVLRERGDLGGATGMPLDKFINDVFVTCDIGDTDLRYASEKKELIWRTVNDETVAAKFNVRHRIRVDVKAPLRTSQEPLDRYIKAEDVHRHRMNADVDDLLSLPFDTPKVKAQSVIKQLSKIYHPDMFANFSPKTRELVEVRLKEFNSANEDRVQNERSRQPAKSDPKDPQDEQPPKSKKGRQLDLD